MKISLKNKFYKNFPKNDNFIKMFPKMEILRKFA